MKTGALTWSRASTQSLWPPSEHMWRGVLPSLSKAQGDKDVESKLEIICAYPHQHARCREDWPHSFLIVQSQLNSLIRAKATSSLPYFTAAMWSGVLLLLFLALMSTWFLYQGSNYNAKSQYAWLLSIAELWKWNLGKMSVSSFTCFSFMLIPFIISRSLGYALSLHSFLAFLWHF